MNTYKVRYDHRGVPCEATIDASGPIVALNHLHRRMQLERKVKPSDYRITGMDWYYLENGLHTPAHAQPVDIPNSPTPDLLRKPKEQRVETMEFAFPE